MNPVEFEILRGKMVSIAEQMGVILQRSSYSPNIRERMDASCAVFLHTRELVAQAEHIPVHLGSLHIPLRHIENFEEGDQIIVNAPGMGGTHLPDITLYKPVYLDGELIGFVGNRAHHADVGGITPGSMPGRSTSIYEEGLIIPPVKIVKRGKIDEDIMALILANTRTPRERRGDITAQIGTNDYGAAKLQEFVRTYGIEKFEEFVKELKGYTSRLMRRRIADIPSEEVEAEDYLELGDELVKIKVRARVKDFIEVDFSGTSRAVRENINAPLAVTLSSVYFFFRSLLGEDIPINSEFYRFFHVHVPEGSILNPPPGYPVVAGNVETSQRIVDTLILAFSQIMDMPAQSHGSMNNIAIGNERFTYYETLGGGAGAFRNYHGEGGIHVYMTNTKNTPVEVIEASYPLLCLEYRLREGSGGRGRWRGGDGIVKRYRVLEDCTFTVISERRKLRPRGMRGGEDGASGQNLIIRKGKESSVDAKATVKLNAGDEIIILTPGGGGYGKIEEAGEGRR